MCFCLFHFCSISEDKEDAVRAILITPPMSDCWTKSKQKLPCLLQQYTGAVGETASSDEFAVLEAKEGRCRQSFFALSRHGRVQLRI
jgi:hypothetical protein